VDDEYLFGADILVAPLFEAQTTGRNVYLPQGQWIDYQTGKLYAAGWHRIEAGRIPIVMLVREGAVISQMQAAQSTAQLDWSKLEMVVYAAGSQNAQGLVCLPSDNVLHKVDAARRSGAFALTSDPLAGKATSVLRLYSQEAR
jgi:alpha-D-xyloside xylohydrolase